MGTKTNKTITAKDGKEYQYFRIQRKVGVKRNKKGEWVPEYKTFYGKSKKEALQKFEAYKAARSKSNMAQKPLGDVIAIWREETLAADSKLKPSTKLLYTDAFDNNLKDHDICTVPLEEVDGTALQQAINSLNCKPTTIHQLTKFLRRFFKYAVAQKYIPGDPSATLTIPEVEHKRTEQEIEIWTEDEIKAIEAGLDAFKRSTGYQHRLRLLICLALDTGMRCGELLGLKYADIDKDARSVFVSRQLVGSPKGLVLTETKTRESRRSIPLSDRVLKELAVHEKWHRAEMRRRKYKSEMVFTTSTGNYVDPQNVRTSLNRFYARYGIPRKSVHTYRHTFASKLAKEGNSIEVVAALLGHESTATTKKYYLNIADDLKRKAIDSLGGQVKNRQIVRVDKSKMRIFQRKHPISN